MREKINNGINRASSVRDDVLVEAGVSYQIYESGKTAYKKFAANQRLK